jgi:hypothetical protein
VLDDNADEVYQSPQRRTKRNVDGEGRVGSLGDEREAKDGGRPMVKRLARRDIVVGFGRASENRRMLRIAFLKSVRKLYCCEPLQFSVSSVLF